MGATSEFLASVPRRADGKRNWPPELKARIVSETLIDGETVKAVAQRYELIPSTVSDWRRMARQGKLVLPNLGGMDFVPVEIEAPALLAERTAPVRSAKPRQTNRGSLPKHLERVEVVIEPDLSCGCGAERHVIGEDVSERLDIIPAQFRVIVTRRPKYACRSCESGITQAPAPAHIIAGGMPTEATLAHVLVSKYTDRLPFYRQAQIYSRQGIDLDRSTLVAWVGKSAFELTPVYDALIADLKRSTKLFMDETPAPVLAPGRKRTKTGYFWALARNDRPWGGE